MLPSFGGDADEEEEMKEVDYVGQRADKETVTDVDEDGQKTVERETYTCPECDGSGHYDEHGDIVCDECGLVLNGEKPIALPTEQDNNRGWSADGDGIPGSKEPRI